MPLGNRSRLQRTVQPPEEVQQAGETGSAVGKKTGQFLHGMVSFYGNMMKGAVKKVKEARTEQDSSSSGYG